MIYRLLVNAAFLAVGYYIGKEVGRLSSAEEAQNAPRTEDAPPPEQDSASADDNETA